MITTDMSNIPPPPTLDEIVAKLPEDFLPDHPPTDRIAQMLAVGETSKQLVEQTQKLLRDESLYLNVTLNMLVAARKDVEDIVLAEKIDFWIKQFTQ